MPSPSAPFHTIIYVRGYAMTKAEQDETTADPFCGFNLGSTVYRATPNKEMPPKKFVFESPLVRLISDYDYTDVYKNGLDIVDPDWSGSIPVKSVVIYRYYEQASSLLGSGETPPITKFAEGLSDLILRVRDLVCAFHGGVSSPADFRCYLVAHSMGGLVCRTFLQNKAYGSDDARRCVDKVFTYATPHNGIVAAGMNVPSWLSMNDMNNFNREYMAKYLDLESHPVYQRTKRVDWLPEKCFPSERFFCMVGTNRMDYEVAKGLSRTFVGDGSDGLVKIANASVWGTDEQGNLTTPCATAYTYRSHSGYFGIVNSEEAYQNLTRFLFGDVRVDIWLDVESVQLPTAIQGKEVNALYQFEALAAPRAMRWYLTRRVSEEDSVACCTYRDLTDPAKPEARHIYLSTVFLDQNASVDAKKDPAKRDVVYALTMNVRAPDYEVEKKFWPNEHFEGGYLFNDTLVIKLAPPTGGNADWTVKFDWQSAKPGQATKKLSYEKLQGGKMQMEVDFGSSKAPGIAGKVRFVVSAWS